MATGWTKQNIVDTEWKLWGDFLYLIDHSDYYIVDYDDNYIVLDSRPTWTEQGVATGTSWNKISI